MKLSIQRFNLTFKKSVVSIALAGLLALSGIFSHSASQVCFAQETTKTTNTDMPGTIDDRRGPLFKKFAWFNSQKSRPNQRRYALEVRDWANKPKPFLGAFLFSCLVSGLAIAFFPGTVKNARRVCRKHYWKCFGRALLTNISLFMLFRIFIESQLTVPLAILFAGTLELLLVAGLAVSICMIGESLLTKLKFDKIASFSSRPAIRNLLIIITGCLVTALIVQIPDLGKLPRIGVRLIMLIATLGEGGLLYCLSNSRKEESL